MATPEEAGVIWAFQNAAPRRRHVASGTGNLLREEGAVWNEAEVVGLRPPCLSRRCRAVEEEEGEWASAAVWTWDVVDMVEVVVVVAVGTETVSAVAREIITVLTEETVRRAVAGS